MTHPLDGFTSPPPLLVIGDDDSSADLAPDGATFLTLVGTTDIGRGWKSVLWMTADRSSLRRLASAVPRLGQVRVVAVWLTDSTVPLVVRPRPEWPAITSAVAREAGRGVLTVLRFASPVPAHQVLVECARQAVDADSGHGGLVVGYAGEPAAISKPSSAGIISAINSSFARTPKRSALASISLRAFTLSALQRCQPSRYSCRCAFTSASSSLSFFLTNG